MCDVFDRLWILSVMDCCFWIFGFDMFEGYFVYWIV